MSHFTQAVRPLALDFLSTIAFAAVVSVTHSLPISVGVSMAVGAGQIVYQKIKGRPIDLMQWASLALVLVFGGAALLTHDLRFVMFKATVIYTAIGVVMLRPGWMNRYAPPIVHEHLSAAALRGWGYAWAGLMFATAGVNLALALHGDVKLWALFIGTAPLASKFAMFAIQYVFIRTQVKGRIVRARLEGQTA